MKKIYTEDRILKSIDRPMLISEIANKNGCKYRCIWNILKPMIKDGRVLRINRCTKDKPLYEYYLPEQTKPKEVQKKKSLKDLCHEI